MSTATRTRPAAEDGTRASSELERELREVIVGMADLLARMIVDEMGRSVGGQEIYVPAPERAARDQAIREFVLNGSTDRLKRIADAAKKFEVSPRTVYRIVSRR